MKFRGVTIDTDSLSIEELKSLINELREVRARKELAMDFVRQMNDLILRAKEQGFTFIDRDCGFVREVNDCEVLDERA